jgi:hypothetical protein
MIMNFIKSIAAGAAFAAVATGANAASVYYSEDTGSYYEVVYDTATFADATTAAETSTMTGVDGTVASGELVSIESWAEFNFVLDTVGTSTKFWIGASDAAVEGEWVWATGEEIDLDTYGGMWIGGAPADTYAGLDYGVLNGAPGLINSTGGSKSFAYIVEYTGLPPVPLPGGLPLAAGAFGLLAFARKRRKQA